MEDDDPIGLDKSSGVGLFAAIVITLSPLLIAAIAIALTYTLS